MYLQRYCHGLPPHQRDGGSDPGLHPEAGEAAQRLDGDRPHRPDHRGKSALVAGAGGATHRQQDMAAHRGSAGLPGPRQSDATNYGGESVSVYVTLQKEENGWTIKPDDPVFTLLPETDASGAVVGLLMTENAAPAAPVPWSVLPFLSDLQFEP